MPAHWMLIIFWWQKSWPGAILWSYVSLPMLKPSQFVLTARLDNLGKGAAGAAVQNMNLMLGIDSVNGLQL